MYRLQYNTYIIRTQCNKLYCFIYICKTVNFKNSFEFLWVEKTASMPLNFNFKQHNIQKLHYQIEMKTYTRSYFPSMSREHKYSFESNKLSTFVIWVINSRQQLTRQRENRFCKEPFNYLIYKCKGKKEGWMRRVANMSIRSLKKEHIRG